MRRLTGPCGDAAARRSSHSESAVHRDGLADDEARAVTTQPEHGVGDLFGTTVPADRHEFQHPFERFGLSLRPHGLAHWRLDEARAYGIDADPSGRILQRRALVSPSTPCLAA